MGNMPVDQTVFLTLVTSIRERECARLFIDSLRSFGGKLSDCPIWLFEGAPQRAPCDTLTQTGLKIVPLTPPDIVRDYVLADKVCACAQAEALATPKIQSLVWFNPDCLVIRPPLLLELAASFDVAIRPVHIRNVGLPATAPLDGYWRKIYEAVGVQDIQATVDSFVDAQHIRAYFNTHAFAVNPFKGLFCRWLNCFETLVCDQEFQSDACQAERHKIFLHQAVLSALIATSIDPRRLRILPPDYSYPYNLHQSVPLDRRAMILNDLVCIAYEDRPLDPTIVDDIEIHEPLRSWLSARTS